MKLPSLKSLFGQLVVAVLVTFVVRNPQQADSMIHSVGAGIVSPSDSLATFASGLGG